MYIRISEGLNKYKLVPEEDLYTITLNPDKDYYTGIFKYNVDQYNKWKESKSVAGIKNVVTDVLVWDFDSKENIEHAKNDTILAHQRLEAKGIPSEAIKISFSGNKGFGLEVNINEHINPEQFKAIAFSVAGDLKTFDKVVNDPQRLIRMVGTKHQASGLYKSPLSFKELTDLSIADIKNQAKDIKNLDSYPAYMSICELPAIFKNIKLEKKEEIKSEIKLEPHEIDFSKKPAYLNEVKYVLHKGHIPPGHGNEGMMILCATYKNYGFDKIDAYHMLKAVNEKRASLYNIDKKDTDEIWNNVVEVVYGPNWIGGVYSSKNNDLLRKIEEEYGLKDRDSQLESPKFISDLNSKFKTFVQNIDKNTIKTGIPTLDKNLFITTGCNTAILGAPSSGKTAISLEILRNTSKAGIKSVFASLDMSSTRIYEKLLYKHTGLPRHEIYKMYENNADDKITQMMHENYGNVFFFDRSQPSVQDIKNYILMCEQACGEKIKLVMLDYFERVFSDIEEENASGKKIAGDLQNLVNDLDICLITLVQPKKMSGDVREPITTYSNIKGSSFLSQAFRMILSIHREGFNPQDNTTDKYLTLNVLKNDLGETNSFDFRWEGKRGEIYDLTPQEAEKLSILRRENAAKHKPNGNNGW